MTHSLKILSYFVVTFAVTLSLPLMKSNYVRSITDNDTAPPYVLDIFNSFSNDTKLTPVQHQYNTIRSFENTVNEGKLTKCFVLYLLSVNMLIISIVRVILSAIELLIHLLHIVNDEDFLYALPVQEEGDGLYSQLVIWYEKCWTNHITSYTIHYKIMFILLCSCILW